MSRYTLPANGYVEHVTWLSGLAFMLFGPIYLLFKGMYGHAWAWVAMIICTLGIAWLVGIFLIPSQIERHLARQGYVRSK
jgi:hypothetical protein